MKGIHSNLSWLSRALLRRTKTKINHLRRILLRPKEPRNDDGRVLLHLGCGNVDGQGFINVDLKVAPHVHHIHDVTDLSMFAENSVDLIYACHVLEHFPKQRLGEILAEWRRVLRPGGTIRLSVPDFDKLLVLYEAAGRNVEAIRQPLLGSEDGYASHLLIWNSGFLTELLQANGFFKVREWSPSSVPEHAFDDWASRGLTVDNKTYPISLNLEADKTS